MFYLKSLGKKITAGGFIFWVGFFLCFLSPILQAEEKKIGKGMRQERWYTLDMDYWDKVPHTKGRLATNIDVEKGKAAFFIHRKYSYKAKPLPIQIPVCAHYKDPITKRKIPVIIIQAERLNMREYIGYVDVETGDLGIGFLKNFKLLDKPTKDFYLSNLD